MLLPLPVQNNIAGIASHRAWHRVTLAVIYPVTRMLAIKEQMI